MEEMNATALQELLAEIIRTEDIKPVVQPIISLRDGSLLGYEVLSRDPENTELEKPSPILASSSRVINRYLRR